MIAITDRYRCWDETKLRIIRRTTLPTPLRSCGTAAIIKKGSVINDASGNVCFTMANDKTIDRSFLQNVITHKNELC